MMRELIALAISWGAGGFDPDPWDIDSLLPRQRSTTYKQAKRRKRRLGFRR